MSCYTPTEFAFSSAYNHSGFASAHVFRIAIRTQTEAVEAESPSLLSLIPNPRGLGYMEMPPDRFGGFAWHHGGERFGSGLLDVAQAAEVN